MTTENPPQQVPPKQIVYNGAAVDASPTPQGVTLFLAVPGLGELHMAPLSIETAQELGRKLTAPRLVAVPANGNGEAG